MTAAVSCDGNVALDKADTPGAMFPQENAKEDIVPQLR